MRLPKFISRYPKTYLIFTNGATRAPQKRSGLGAEDPTWLREVRPGMLAIPKPEGDRASAEGWEVTHGRWRLEGDGMREPWALLARLEDPTWLCDVQLAMGRFSALG